MISLKKKNTLSLPNMIMGVVLCFSPACFQGSSGSEKPSLKTPPVETPQNPGADSEPSTSETPSVPPSTSSGAGGTSPQSPPQQPTPPVDPTPQPTPPVPPSPPATSPGSSANPVDPQEAKADPKPVTPPVGVNKPLEPPKPAFGPGFAVMPTTEEITKILKKNEDFYRTDFELVEKGTALCRSLFQEESSPVFSIKGNAYQSNPKAPIFSDFSSEKVFGFLEERFFKPVHADLILLFQKLSVAVEAKWPSQRLESIEPLQTILKQSLRSEIPDSGAMMFQLLGDRLAPSSDSAGKYAHSGSGKKIDPQMPSEKAFLEALKAFEAAYETTESNPLVRSCRYYQHLRKLQPSVSYNSENSLSAATGKPNINKQTKNIWKLLNDLDTAKATTKIGGNLQSMSLDGKWSKVFETMQALSSFLSTSRFGSFLQWACDDTEKPHEKLFSAFVEIANQQIVWSNRVNLGEIESNQYQNLQDSQRANEATRHLEMLNILLKGQEDEKEKFVKAVGEDRSTLKVPVIGANPAQNWETFEKAIQEIKTWTGPKKTE